MKFRKKHEHHGSFVINHLIMPLSKKSLKSHSLMIFNKQVLIVQASHISVTFEMLKFVSTESTVSWREIVAMLAIISNISRSIGVQSSIYEVKKGGFTFSLFNMKISLCLSSFKTSIIKYLIMEYNKYNHTGPLWVNTFRSC